MQCNILFVDVNPAVFELITFDFSLNDKTFIVFIVKLHDKCKW